METWVGDYEPQDHEKVLKDVFGFAGYRPGQKDIIEAVLRGQDVLATLPTGRGKSLGYKLPAAMSRKGSTTVVVSPLIALMRDQVASLDVKKIPGVDLHSQKPDAERKSILEGIRNRVYALVFVSPEQLRNRAFKEHIQNIDFAGLAVDEAHCIVQWGHDFRPDYMSIGDFIEMRGIPQVSAFTATASNSAKKEIKSQLLLKNPLEYHDETERPNLSYDVAMLNGPKQKPQVITEYIDKLAPGKHDAVIIYCASRPDTEEIALFLQAQGLPADYYHAGLEGDERRKREEKFLNDETRILVATNAFGMGIDKPNIRLVIHHRLPGSVEQYLQESGRAGRDGDRSHCILLYCQGDRNVHDYFIADKAPSINFIKTVYDAIAHQYVSGRHRNDEWFPLNRTGIHRAFTYDNGNGEKNRNTSVNAAIDFMVENGILECKGDLIKLHGFPVTEDEFEILEQRSNTRRHMSQVSLGQMLSYAEAEFPSQRMLVELLNDRIIPA